jgi:hypothetical protein
MSLFLEERRNIPPHTPLASPRIQQGQTPSPHWIPIIVATGDNGVAIGASVGRFVVAMRPPWLAQEAVAIPRVHHDLPKNLKKFLPMITKKKLPKTLLIDSCYLSYYRIWNINMWFLVSSHTHSKGSYPHGILVYLKAQSKIGNNLKRPS